MKYFIQHKYRVSQDFNTFDLHPWHGAGQGAADAALCYIVLSDLLIDTYNAKAQPWTIHDPTLTLPLLKSLKAFIDDVVMSAGGMHNNLQDLVKATQSQVQWWNKLIQASGGTLNPNKCCCMVHTWMPDKFGILHHAPPPMNSIQIALSLDTNSPKLPVLQPCKGTCYLGLYINQLGTTQPMEKHI